MKLHILIAVFVAIRASSFAHLTVMGYDRFHIDFNFITGYADVYVTVFTDQANSST